VSALATYGVGYVLLIAGDGTQISAMDGAPGLVRSSAGALSGATAWRLDADPGPVRLAEHPGAAGTLGAGVLPDDAGAVRTHLDPGGPAAGPRILTLGEQADGGWEATLDGDSLEPRTADGWAQAFTVPAAGGDLVVDHQGRRRWWLGEQAVVLALALVMVAPGRRRTDEPH
jgi:hypothetical protein